MDSTLYLQLPSDEGIQRELDRYGMAICTDTMQALRFAEQGIRVIRRDIVDGKIKEIELSAATLQLAISLNWEMRGTIQ